jgi:hypothetical protein
MDLASGLGSLGRLGACRSFIICLPILGMFGGPLGGLLFGGETLDYFRLAIGPENIDNPAKSGRIALSHTENGPMFGHATNMRLRRPGSSAHSSHILIRCSTRRSTIRRATDFRTSHPATIKLTHYPAIAAIGMRYAWNDAQFIGIRRWNYPTIYGTKR